MKSWLVCLIFLYSGMSFAREFDRLMGFASHDPYQKKNKESIEFFRWLFKKNKRLLPKNEVIIPKLVHIIWIGPHEQPVLLKKCLESVERLLPDWTCKLWTDKEVHDLNLVNQLYYDQAETYAEKADILRYEILYRYGGVYLDSDIELVKALDELHYTYQFYAGVLPPDVQDDLNNAVIGSIPGHPILRHCIDTIKDDRQWSSITKRTGPSHFKRSFLAIAQDYPEQIIALPKTAFYPLDYTKRHLTYDEAKEQVHKESYAIHFWASSWREEGSSCSK